MWFSLDGGKHGVNGIVNGCSYPCFIGAHNKCECSPCPEDDLGCQVAVDAIMNGCPYGCYVGHNGDCICPPWPADELGCTPEAQRQSKFNEWALPTYLTQENHNI